MAENQEPKASLAFTFQKKKVAQKVAVNVEERKDAGQLISGFDGAKAQVIGGDGEGSKTYVIPKLENTFKTGVGPKKFTPTFKPPSDQTGQEIKPGEDKFVQAASTVPVITEYGLQLRDVKPEDRAKAAGAINGSGTNVAATVLEERAFRESVEELPDVADEEAYEAMPVEEFGRAMLRGMGWEDGMGVGRNRRKVDAIEYVRRPERLGLGAQPVKLGEDPSKPVKMGDKPRRQDLVLAPDADGRQRNIKTLDEKLVVRSTVLPGPAPGKQMRITAGPHSGLACTALEALPKAEGKPERWRVRLAASNEEVDVLAGELGERWERGTPPPAAAAAGAGAGAGSGRGASREPERDRDRQRSADRERERERGREGSGGPDRGGPAGGEAAGPSSRRAGSADDDDGEAGRRGDRNRDRRHEDEGRRDRDRDRDGVDYDGGGGGGSKRGQRDRGDDAEERDEDRRHSKKHKHEKKHKHDKHEKKHKKDKDKDRERDKESDRHKHDSRGGRGDGSSSEEEDDGGGGGKRSGPTWLFPHIKVRIVDKRVRGGKLYLKKGTVVDVHPGGTADVAVDDTGDVLRLSESSLETVVPKHQGAPVLVVAGPHRGARGRLLQASTSAGAAAVQLAADFSIVRLLLDDVAGYAGELEDE